MADQEIVDLLRADRLTVDPATGVVLAPKSNTPTKPCGASTAKGYLRVCVSIGGRQRHFLAHRIVWVSAKGPVPAGYTIDHLNEVKTDNRLVNLEAVPAGENTRRAAANGRYAGGGRRDGIRDALGRFGKKAAGRELDGRTWDEYPAVPS